MARIAELHIVNDQTVTEIVELKIRKASCSFKQMRNLSL